MQTPFSRLSLRFIMMMMTFVIIAAIKIINEVFAVFSVFAEFHRVECFTQFYLLKMSILSNLIMHIYQTSIQNIILWLKFI